MSDCVWYCAALILLSYTCKLIWCFSQANPKQLGAEVQFIFVRLNVLREVSWSLINTINHMLYVLFPNLWNHPVLRIKSLWTNMNAENMNFFSEYFILHIICHTDPTKMSKLFPFPLSAFLKAFCGEQRTVWVLLLDQILHLNLRMLACNFSSRYSCSKNLTCQC